MTEGFEVKVGLHQGSALSPCLFAMVMDRITDDIREEAPWTMMFADDIVICSERQGTGRREAGKLEIYSAMTMQGEEVAKVEDFKYLGSTVQSNGECRREMKKRVQA